MPKSIRGEDQVADAELDEALDKLSAALLENTVACAKVRRRQSSGAVKIVSIPAPLPSNK